MDPVIPATSAQTKKALQHAPDFDWNQKVEDQDYTHLEHCSVEQEEGQEDPSFSPLPVEPLCQEGSREEAEKWSH